MESVQSLRIVDEHLHSEARLDASLKFLGLLIGSVAMGRSSGLGVWHILLLHCHLVVRS